MTGACLPHIPALLACVVSMTGKLFKMMAGVDMQHVPDRGGGPRSSI